MSESLTYAAVVVSDALAVERGRKAWTTIQAARSVMRREWRALGRALLIGRKEHRDSDTFDRWCIVHGLEGIPALAQTGAEEFAHASESRVIQGTVPAGIRQWYRNRAVNIQTQRIHHAVQNESTIKRPKSFGSTKRIKLIDDQALITRGQAVWTRIKKSATARRALSRGAEAAAEARRRKSKNEHIQWWCAVGEALEVGRNSTALDRHGAYGAWLRAKGFDDVSDPQAAIWLAANIRSLGEIPGNMTNPSHRHQSLSDGTARVLQWKPDDLEPRL